MEKKKKKKKIPKAFNKINLKDDLFIDLTNPNEEEYEAISKVLGVKISSYEQLLEIIPNHFSGMYGKIGYMYLDPKGEIVKKVQNDKIQFDKAYRDFVEKNRFTPEFIARKNRNENYAVQIFDEAEEKAKKVIDVENYDSFLHNLNQQAPKNKEKIIESVTKIIEDGGAKKEVQEKVENSVMEGIRLNNLEELANELKGYACMMTETTSKKPDKSHMFLEGQPIECGKLLGKIMTRFGCKHSFVVIKPTKEDKALIDIIEKRGLKLWKV